VVPPLALPFVFLLAPSVLHAQTTHHVGPGQPFTRIEPALAAAQPGDTILVHPLANNAPYDSCAIRIATPRVTLRAQNPPGGRIILSGKNADLSGIGSHPRAIVQFEPAAHGSRLEGFELRDAHNASHNGAGARIHQANDITIADCVIHHNDMGIMSKGDGTPRAANRQRIERCLIFSNGDPDDPGYNHNLYLGGTSATLIGCTIYSSRTGHNVKSRAHRTEILACFIHSSANREIDLVDAQGDTSAPGSDALIAGCLIMKSAEGSGNRGVIHFGQDGGHPHNGTLALLHNTILTPFIAPVVQLSTPDARLALFNNCAFDPAGQARNQVLVALPDESALDPAQIVAGSHNALGRGFEGARLDRLGLDHSSFVSQASLDRFRSAPRLELPPAQPGPPDLVDQGLPLDQLPPHIPAAPLFEYHATQGYQPRTITARPDLGACEFPINPPAR
jgi:hypothetical protein